MKISNIDPMTVEIMNPDPYVQPSEQFIPFAAVLGRSANFTRLEEACGGRITPEALRKIGEMPMHMVPHEVIVQFLDYSDKQRKVRAGNRRGLRVMNGGLS